MKNINFTAHIEKDKETGLYTGMVVNLPGAHTQAASLDELHKNLEEVISLCLGCMTEEEINELPSFVGFQQLTVAV